MQMWNIRSLSQLTSTLAELGATANLKNVSSEEEYHSLWGPTTLMTYTLSVLDSMEDSDFFLCLNFLSEMVRAMQSVLVAAPELKVDEVEQTLRPMYSTLSHLCPKKALGGLLDMKDFLQGIGGYNRGREDCLKHLVVLHEHLEELRPGDLQQGLEELRDLLMAKGPHLAWLASHPVIEKKLGRQNLFARLVFFRVSLKDAIADDFLGDLQETLEEMDRMQAFNFRN